MPIRLSAAGAGLVAAVAMGGLSVLAGQSPAAGEPFDLGVLHWRHLGPMQGGETTAVAGDASDPRVLYLGTAGGGVWKTGDFGRTWRPIFDRQPTGVIGAIVAAPSDPRVLYVGTGTSLDVMDLPDGTGLYKSTDGGLAWTRLPLEGSGRIPRIAVHPSESGRILVAALGPTRGPAGQPGIHRSTDGGQTFVHVLGADADTGGADVTFDPHATSTAYAALWQARADVAGRTASTGSAVFRSTDAGATWQPMTGLPTALADGLGRTTLAASRARAGRVFASVSARTRAGLYRSDDAGVTWALMSDDPRLAGADLATDSADPDVVYAAGAAALRSSDGGRTWTLWRRVDARAPYRGIWIHPSQQGLGVLASAGGAFVTVNGGETWSAGDGQPTAAFSQVATDAAFPYRVCGGQPDGNVVCVPSRGGHSTLTWPAGGTTRPGYVVGDPAEADVLYGSEVQRLDRRSGQALDIGPPGQPASNPGASAPLAYSTTSPRALYFASTALWTSTNGGQAWTRVSPEFAEAPAAAAGAGRAGAISAFSVSAIDSRVIWIGTSLGGVHLTRDRGATWTDVTPASGARAGPITRLEASFFDTNTAYAIVADVGAGPSRLIRTRASGASWTDLTAGLPAGGWHAVREDSARRGLLFLAGDASVMLSFDDGDSWQSLRLNLPPAPVRDLVMKDADLIAATAGRGFWVLDDISPLRQITADVWRASAFLFRPPVAWRTRSSPSANGDDPMGSVTPPAPEGVAISYALGADRDDAVVVDIVDGPAGDLVRRYSAETSTPPPPTGQGLHRLRWDLRHTPPAVEWLDTDGDAVAPLGGRWVEPGTYQIRLMAGTTTLRQAVVVRLDPRVRASDADLTLQTRLTRAVEDSLAALEAAYRAVARRQAVLPASPGGSATTHVLEALQAAGRSLARTFVTLQQADARPTAATEAAVSDALARATSALEQAK